MKRTRIFAIALVACGHAAPPPSPGAPTAALPPLPPSPPDPFETKSTPVAAPAPNESLHLAPIDQSTYDKAHELARSGDLREAKRLFAKLLLAYPDREALLDDYNKVQSRIDAVGAAARASIEARPLQRLAPPPATYTLVRPARVDPAPIPKLVLVAKSKNQIIDDEAWFSKNDVHRPEYFVLPAGDFFFAPGVQSTTIVQLLGGFVYTEVRPSLQYLPAEPPLWLPPRYGTLPLAHAIQSTETTIALYGGGTRGARVLAVFDETGRARALYDFEAFEHPPANKRGRAQVGQVTLTTPKGTQTGAIEAETNTITHELTWALARGGTLFVEHTNLYYAKENHGQNAYVSALDLDTGEMMWRSAPLVANARCFAMVGGAVVAGYGFTDEPDFVFVLDAATGAVRQKILVPSGPEEIIAKDGRVYVRTYDTDLVFDVK